MRKVHVVAHTHWDREWYFTIEDSNALLVEHMDYLINYLEGNPSFPHFVFDGQVSVIETYLNYRPENKERLIKLIKEDRIHIGPWYTQADSLNPKLESIIRNLVYGVNLAKEFGGNMNIGYLPDAFGQNAYLPSIFTDCEIDYSVLQRGISTDDAQNGLNFNWVAPNGKTIKSNYIFFGYGPGKFLSTDSKYLDEKLLPILQTLEEYSHDEEILLPSGGDQALIRTHFCETIKGINKLQSKYNLELSKYETFMQSIDFTDKQEIHGELYTPQKSRIHRTIHSQRMDLKILNTQVEKKLIEILEPLTALATKLKISTNNVMLDEIWKLLFDVHAHDSIGGCNSDATNSNIIARLHSISYRIDNQINILKKKISLAIAETNEVILFNFNQTKSKTYEMIIYTATENFTLTKDTQEINFSIIKQQLIDGGTKIEVTASGEKQVPLPGYYETTISFTLESSVIGYQIFKVTEVNEEVEAYQKELSVSELTTDYYDFKFDDQLIIKTKKEQLILGFESQSDVGDSYDFAYIDGEKPIITTKYDKIKIYELENFYQVMATYSVEVPNKENLDVITNIEINKNNNRLKITHQLVNTEIKHRLRAIFLPERNDGPAIVNSYTDADSGFGTITRTNIDPNITNYRELNYVEKPLAVYPFERFVTLDNLTIFNSDVKEYEITDSYFALTLFRSVDVLGRDDLTTRPNRASGINNVTVYTPDAELLNHEFTINYYLTLSEEKENGYHLYNSVATNYDYYQQQSYNVFTNRIDRFELPVTTQISQRELILANLTEGLLLSSITILNNKICLRVFNPSDEPITIDLNDKQYFTNLLANKLTNEKKLILNAKDYITICEDL